jgi:hypothetical protein
MFIFEYRSSGFPSLLMSSFICRRLFLCSMIRGERSFFVLYYIGGIIDKHCLILFFIVSSFK